MEIVPQHDTKTLLPIIQAHTRQGTIIPCDEWAAYNRVQLLPTVCAHQTVNLSLEFVNSTTGMHTQNIESYWNRSKTKVKRMKGCHQQMLPSHLDKFMWREKHGRTASQALNSIIRHCGSVPCLIIPMLPWTAFILNLLSKHTTASFLICYQNTPHMRLQERSLMEDRHTHVRNMSRDDIKSRGG